MKYLVTFLLLLNLSSFAQKNDKQNLLLCIDNIKRETVLKDPLLLKIYNNDDIFSLIDGKMTLLATESEYAKLKGKGYNLNIIMKDDNKVNLFRRAILGESMKLPEVYQSYDKIFEKVDALENKFPDILKKFSIGITTQSKKNIFAVKISNNVNKMQDKPRILLNGCHHSNELLGAEICLSAIDYLVENYNKDKKVTEWVNNYEIFIIPVINVDGYEVVFKENNPNWRKNTRDLNRNGILEESDGIDLNRNYDFNFSFGGSYDSLSERYRGSYPFSESETQAIRNLAIEQKFIFSLSFHSEGEVIYYPWNWGNRKAPDDSILTRIASDLAGNIKTMKGDTCYRAERGAGLVGQSYTWFYGRIGTFDFIIETANGTSIPNEEFVGGIVKSNLNGIKYILERAKGPGLSGHITDAETGKPLEAVVWFPQIETEELDRRTSDPETGRFWRVLFPKSYKIVFMKEGYETRVLNNFKINEGVWTELDIKLERIKVK